MRQVAYYCLAALLGATGVGMIIEGDSTNGVIMTASAIVIGLLYRVSDQTTD